MPSNRLPAILNRIDAMRDELASTHVPNAIARDMAIFIQDIAPLLDEIHGITHEGIHKMPLASSQLARAASATETAAEQIFSLVDGAVTDLASTQDEVEATIRQLDERKEMDHELFAELHQILADDHPEILEALESYGSLERQRIGALEVRLATSVHTFSVIRKKMNRIVESLQVQDVVRQQLAAVDHQIENLRERLDALSQELSPFVDRDAGVRESQLTSGDVFDANAHFDATSGSQDAVDETIELLRAGLG